MATRISCYFERQKNNEHIWKISIYRLSSSNYSISGLAEIETRRNSMYNITLKQ